MMHHRIELTFDSREQVAQTTVNVLKDLVPNMGGENFKINHDIAVVPASNDAARTPLRKLLIISVPGDSTEQLDELQDGLTHFLVNAQVEGVLITKPGPDLARRINEEIN